MSGREDRKKKLKEASDRAAAAADKELAARLESIRLANDADLEALKPRLSDPEAFDQLVAAVRHSTALNETQAGLRKRIKALGKGVVAVAKEAADLLKP